MVCVGVGFHQKLYLCCTCLDYSQINVLMVLHSLYLECQPTVNGILSVCVCDCFIQQRKVYASLCFHNYFKGEANASMTCKIAYSILHYCANVKKEKKKQL